MVMTQRIKVYSVFVEQFIKKVNCLKSYILIHLVEFMIKEAICLSYKFLSYIIFICGTKSFHPSVGGMAVPLEKVFPGHSFLGTNVPPPDTRT